MGEGVETRKRRLPLLDYLEQHNWKGRPAGRGEYVGLCPLHEESRPSFYVNTRKDVFYCHGCGRGGDLMNRAVGCARVVPFVGPIGEAMTALDPSVLRMGANFPPLFNLALAVLFLPPLGGVARLLERLLPANAKPADPASPVYLDQAAAGSPALALACATRESLRMGDMVQTMLEQAMAALMTGDRKLVEQVSRMDDVVDRLHEAIKLYVVGVTRDTLDEREGRRAMELIAFAINMGHIGDIIDKNLMELAAKKIKRRLAFSDEGAAELRAMHERVLDDLDRGRIEDPGDQRPFDLGAGCVATGVGDPVAVVAALAGARAVPVPGPARPGARAGHPAGRPKRGAGHPAAAGAPRLGRPARRPGAVDVALEAAEAADRLRAGPAGGPVPASLRRPPTYQRAAARATRPLSSRWLGAASPKPRRPPMPG